MRPLLAAETERDTPIDSGKRRLAAIMFTDIVGFTAIAQGNEQIALRLLQENNRLTRNILREYGGREVKTIGDSFLVEFASALQAVRCSIAIQEKVRERNSNLPPKEQIALRIGIHVGEVVENGTDILGDAVNVSSRIQPLAEPGGICISQQVYDHVRNKIDFKLEMLDATPLKNVNHQVNVYRILMHRKQEPEDRIELDNLRIAVLPLKNMSPDPNDEYFADGMTEELIMALSGVRELTVIARTSIMQYKSTPKRASEIGRDLRTGTLIEGSVRKAANKVRITVQLIDAISEGHLWAQNYDRTMDDIFAIQSEIAEKVADALRIKLVGAEKKKLESRHTESVEGFTLYLKGRHFWNERNKAGLNKAIEYFQEAIKRDPNFALGYAGLADCYYVLRSNRISREEGEVMKTKELVLKAISLDDSIAEPHATLAMMLFYDEHNFKKADAEYRRAIELNPNYPTAHQWYAHFLLALRSLNEMMAEIRKAIELDPLSPIINTNMGDALYYSGNPEASLEYYSKALEISWEFLPAYYSQIQPLCYLKRFEDAIRRIDEFEKIANHPDQAKFYRAYVDAHRGEKEKVRKVIAEAEDKGGSVSLYFMALTCFVLGDVDKAFEFMEKAYERSEHELLNLAVDRELDDARSDPRYLSLISKIGLDLFPSSSV